MLPRRKSFVKKIRKKFNTAPDLRKGKAYSYIARVDS